MEAQLLQTRMTLRRCFDAPSQYLSMFDAYQCRRRPADWRAQLHWAFPDLHQVLAGASLLCKCVLAEEFVAAWLGSVARCGLAHMLSNTGAYFALRCSWYSALNKCWHSSQTPQLYHVTSSAILNIQHSVAVRIECICKVPAWLGGLLLQRRWRGLRYRPCGARFPVRISAGLPAHSEV